MSEIEFNVELPLDEGFLRRECPYCKKEFKIVVNDDEQNQLIEDLSHNVINQFEENELSDEFENSEDNILYTCPYCRQTANKDTWWTINQLDYIHTIVNNWIQDQLFGSLKQMGSSSSSDMFNIEITYDKSENKTPWIASETNDMTEYDLPCCEQKIKLEDEWKQGASPLMEYRY